MIDKQEAKLFVPTDKDGLKLFFPFMRNCGKKNLVSMSLIF